MFERALISINLGMPCPKAHSLLFNWSLLSRYRPFGLIFWRFLVTFGSAWESITKINLLSKRKVLKEIALKEVLQGLVDCRDVLFSLVSGFF